MLKHPFGKYTFSIKSYHSDQSGKLTLSALFHFLQECAWDNARQNDFGFEFLKSKNAFWVLSRVLVQIDEYPHWKDEIEIKTWPKGVDGFFALRDFEIYLNNKVIGRVTSSWLILDRNTKRPLKPDSFNFYHENFLKDEAIKQKLDKINCNNELIELDQRKVYNSDLDVNKHVNNATYVRWILDSYFTDNCKKEIKEFEINFLLELTLNDNFHIFTSNTEIDSYFVLKSVLGKEICKASIKQRSLKC